MTITVPVSTRYVSLPVWDYVTDRLLIADVVYEPNRNPYMVQIRLADLPAPLDVPRDMLAAGLDNPAASAELAQYPMNDGEHVLWHVRSGVDLVTQRILRVHRTVLGQALAGLYELVPEGREGECADWDGEYERLCGRTP